MIKVHTYAASTPCGDPVALFKLSPADLYRVLGQRFAKEYEIRARLFDGFFIVNHKDDSFFFADLESRFRVYGLGDKLAGVPQNPIECLIPCYFYAEPSFSLLESLVPF